MGTPEKPDLSSPSSSSSTCKLAEPKMHINSNANSPSLSGSRLWRPAAQRNLRNQWSKFLSLKQQWFSASSTGKSNAESLVNAHLLQRYMPVMDLGVLKNMVDIRKKACCKLALKQERHGSKLLLSYKDMVSVVCDMVNISSSLRCFSKGPANSPLVRFSCHAEDKSNLGDGGGIPVFTFWPIQYFENLAHEVVQMFSLELILKRLLVAELLSLSCNDLSRKFDRLSWSNELFPGEFDELNTVNLYSEDACQPVAPG
ncbi:hypothetical protein GIB67_000694 [Kingdonia uniflora]|uniref:Uncharacterized protein n=1 Tax=Kingdonia uniflora TaxID=39325 RepID=A0A7J7NDM9_9MAGN|nr:hypothetical protein GIB67_000694 [Kingdonia uniflora]